MSRLLTVCHALNVNLPRLPALSVVVPWLRPVSWAVTALNLIHARFYSDFIYSRVMNHSARLMASHKTRHCSYEALITIRYDTIR